MHTIAKRTVIKKYIQQISARTAHSDMYNHILIHLKRRPGQKQSEATAYRNEIDKTVENELKGQVKYIISLDASFNLAWELNTSFNTPDEIPPSVKNVLESSKVVDNFTPAFRTEPEADPNDCPSYENLMNTFTKLTQAIDCSKFDFYSLRVQPGRQTCMPARELSLKIRDDVESIMNSKQKYHDRSFTAKQKLETLQAEIKAKYELTKDPILENKKPEVLTIPLQLNLFKTAGFWSQHTFNGAGSVAAATAQHAKERKERLPGGEFHGFPFNRHIAQRVVICKIGEIFLKKGNRFRFMLQLQNNIQTKVGHIGHVVRCTHFFVIQPFPANQVRNQAVQPFTDEQLAEIQDAASCIPGVEGVRIALQAQPTVDDMTRCVQYLLAVATADKLPTLDKPIESYSLLSQTDLTKKVAESLFIPLDENATEEMKAKHEEYKAIASKGLYEACKLGWNFDLHNQQPSPFTSRSGLMKDINILNRTLVGKYNGLSGPIPTPAEFIRQSSPDQGMLEKEADVANDDSLMTDASTALTSGSYQWTRPRSGINIRVEVNKDYSYVYFETGTDSKEAVGGQPTGTSADTQTVVALLSGGMDSPVAAFSLMTRGMRVVLVHFQNANLADEDTVKHKIVKLAEQLSRYQISTYLHIVPFSAIQDAIIMEVPGPARMLVYRRFMMQVSARIAMRYNAKFLVVGDALGQVASQTASNLYASYIDTPLPILSPLIGSNKKDIMNIARKIGTYDISAMPYGDCCSYFLAKHPMTRIQPELLKQYESSVGSNIEGGANALIAAAAKSSAIIRWYKPQDGMEVIREIRPVESKYREIVDDMMKACPMRPKDKDGDDINENEAIEYLRKRAEEEEKMMNDESNINLEENENVEDNKENVFAEPSAKKQRTNAYNEGLHNDLVKQTSKLNISDLYMSNNSKPTSYLDSAATTRLLPEALNAMLPYLAGTMFGNSSSVHELGSISSAALEEARRVILGSINAPMDTTSAFSQDNSAIIGETKRKSKEQLLAFTSGGTESNNIAIVGSVRAAVENYIKKENTESNEPINIRIHLITSSLEHSAILEPIRMLEKDSLNIVLTGSGYANVKRPLSIKVDVSYLRNNIYGEVDTEHIEYILNKDCVKTDDYNTILSLVSIMTANNEVGVVQPIVKIGQAIETIRQKLQTIENANPLSIIYHTDACQSYSKLFLDVQEANLDLVSLNGHKVHGPKGVGALYIRPGVQITPLVYGGGHEGNIRSGTVNIPSIVGMAAAVAYFHGIQTSLLDTTLAHQPLTVPIKSTILRTATSSLIHSKSNVRVATELASFNAYLSEIFKKVTVNGPVISSDLSLCPLDGTPSNRLPNVISVLLGKSGWIDSTAILKFLSARGVYVSSGSACASNSEPAPSHVLLALKIRPETANSTIRISFGHLTSDEEINHAKMVFAELADLMTTKTANIGRR